MKSCVILVDNSNLFIEGMKFSAWDKGLVGGHDIEPTDTTWRLDFETLLEYLAEGRKIISAILVSSSPPDSPDLWRAAERRGFEVLVHERNSAGVEKGVDVHLAITGTRLIHTIDLPPEQMCLVIASGDSDFQPLAEEAKRKGWQVELCSFSSAFNPRGKLAAAVDRVRLLDESFDLIGRYAISKVSQ